MFQLWLFTRYGFFSTTQSPYQPGAVQIRARDPEDLERLKDAVPDLLEHAQVVETPTADYGWRLVVSQQTWVAVAARLASSNHLDYSNFKNEATRGLPHLSPLLHRIWSAVMMAYEEFRTPLATSRQMYLYETPDDVPDIPTVSNFNGEVVGHICPQCGVEAETTEAAERLFGFREDRGKFRVQSWCRDCTAEYHRQRRNR